MSRKPLRYLTRSIRLLEKKNWLVDIVERRITFMVSKDLFGFLDLLAISPDKKMVGIQVTSGGCLRDHINKLTESPDIRDKIGKWMDAGGVVHAHIWRKKKAGRVCDVYYIDRDFDWSREESHLVP